MINHRLMRLMLVPAVVGALTLTALCGLAEAADPSPEERVAKNTVVQFANALENYNIDYGYYPQGSLAELINTLMGNNQRKVVYFETTKKNFNARGELIDPWQTPYRVDFGMFGRPHVSSAGKNKIFDGDAVGSDDIRSWD